jgi:hypothetical protein
MSASGQDQDSAPTHHCRMTSDIPSRRGASPLTNSGLPPPDIARPGLTAVTDGFGLPLTTTPEAAAHYRVATLHLLGGDAGAVTSYVEAVRADSGFALGHVGVAVAGHSLGRDASVGLAAARIVSRRVTRRERQHVEVVSAALHGDLARTAALGLEHLAEFPADAVAFYALSAVAADLGDPTLCAEMGRLASNVPWAAGRHTEG